jgi:hypothetical protein
MTPEQELRVRAGLARWIDLARRAGNAEPVQCLRQRPEILYGTHQVELTIGRMCLRVPLEDLGFPV